MKKVFLLTFALCYLLSVPLTATTYRVNNKVADNATLKIYNTPAKAHDAAQSGDTIMIEGSQTNYPSGWHITKKLIIKGPGYFLDNNPGVSANKLPAVIEAYFEQGSEGSVVMGVMFNNLYTNSADDVTFRRCNIKNYLNYTACQNIAFSECYFTSNPYNTFTTTTVFTNLVVMNCIFNGGIAITSGSTGLFLNNVFNHTVISIPTGFDMKNNILFTAEKTDVHLPAIPDIDVCNNISISDHFGTDNNNKANVSSTALFVGDATTSPDGRWQLKAGSPAIGAGVGGIDCGAFGGPGPYVLCGVPTGPVIYQLNVASHSTSTNKLPVTIKVRSY